MTRKAQETKAKIDKQDQTKLNSYCGANEKAIYVMGVNFAHNISDKELIVNIYN